jgi:pimeloyl-ACP methyl ester carboxylesterase
MQIDEIAWRSPDLGEARSVATSAGPLDYFDRGDGPCLVFSHGWLTNANLWRKVVDRLATSHRCVTLDLPLGSHRTPMRPDADLSPTSVAGLIAEVIEAVGLRNVTLVGNDSGGAYSQIAVARHPQHIAGLVLTSCETPDDPWPPAPFDALPGLALDPAALRAVLLTLADPAVRMSPPAYGLLLTKPVEPRVFDTYALAATADDAILRDISKVMSATTSAAVHGAADILLGRRDLPVLLVWPEQDTVFPVEHARRYARSLVHGRIETITDSLSLTPEDRPDALVIAIAKFTTDRGCDRIRDCGQVWT